MSPEDKLLVDVDIVQQWKTQPPIDERDIKLVIALDALRSIQKLGHGTGHGKGYTCATMAKNALDKIGD